MHSQKKREMDKEESLVFIYKNHKGKKVFDLLQLIPEDHFNEEMIKYYFRGKTLKYQYKERMSLERFAEVNENTLIEVFAETGADRELDFDPERLTEEIYNDLEEKLTKDLDEKRSERNKGNVREAGSTQQGNLW